MAVARKIHPFLWFDGCAEDAAAFYVDVFGGSSRIADVPRISAGPAAGGSIVDFELAGQKFTALDGGPAHTITPAISLVVSCESQAEIDAFRARFSDGGQPGTCGWVRDRFGVSWQVLPAQLGAWARAAPESVMPALMEMGKIDFERLRRLGGG